MLVRACFLSLLVWASAQGAPAGLGSHVPWDLPGEGPLYHLYGPAATRAVDAVLIIGTTGGSNLASGLRSHFATVDYFDANNATPSADDLQAYVSVVTYAGWGYYGDPTSLGNVLADYADGGGGVVLTQLNHYTNPLYYPAGRLLESAYRTINRGSGNGSPSLGSYDQAHPIMNGVQAVAGTWSIGNTSRASEAEWVASWTDDLPAATVSSNRKVVGLNMYVSDEASNTGDWIQWVANALRYASGEEGSGFRLFLTDTPDTVSPCDDVRFFVDLINSGEESEALDEAVLSIVGPASAELTLLDHELVLAPQDQRSVAVTVGVSCVAPAGVYECTLEIRNDGESLTSESFETEVLP